MAVIDVSYSSSADYRTCNRKFYYRNVLKLEPKKLSSALSLGTVFHNCFDMLFQKKTKPEIHQYVAKFYEDAIRTSLDPSQQEWLSIDQYKVLGMWDNYPLNDMEFEKVEPEVSFRVKLDGLKGIYLKGRVDGLVVRQGKYWIREVKTTSMKKGEFQKKASVSYQGSGYIYGVEKFRGIKIEGVVYDVVFKPALRRGVHETAGDFGERIYQDYCNPDRKDFYYLRFFTYRSAKEIEEFEKDMVLLARDLRTRTREGKWYRNTDRCYDFNKECDFRPICWTDKPDEGLMQSLYERKGK